jgi:hypothetical protein
MQIRLCTYPSLIQLDSMIVLYEGHALAMVIGVIGWLTW